MKMAERSPKELAMTAIQEALGNTKIVSAKVWNLWPKACEEGLVIDNVQGTPELTAAPTTIPEDATFVSLTGIAKMGYLGQYRQLSKSNDVELTAETLGHAKIVLKTEYLRWGRTNWKGIKGANCTYFAGVTIGFLSDNIALVPEGAVVEQFNLKASGEGHAFVVIGRNQQSDPGTPSTWGNDCFIVDQWYARQRVNRPGTFAVKDLGEGSIFYDAPFLEFIRTGGSLSRGPAFSRTELIELR